MIAVDLGCYEFRSLRLQDQRLAGRRSRTDYIALPISEMKQKLLDQSGIRYARCEDSFLLVGTEADRWSRMVQIPISSVLPDGRVPTGDPPARQLMAGMIESLVPQSASPHSICALTLPGGRIEEENNSELAFFARLIRMRGYRVLPVHASHSITLAELGKSNLTGVGLSIGAETCEMSVTRFGVELVHASIKQGSHKIEQEMAQFSDCYAWDISGNRFLDLETIRDWKASLERDLCHPHTEDEHFLTDRCRELIKTALVNLGRILAREPHQLNKMPGSVPLVVNGGLCQIKGFAKLFNEVLESIPLPLPISVVLHGGDPQWTVARGSLIHAELAQESTTQIDCKEAA